MGPSLRAGPTTSLGRISRMSDKYLNFAALAAEEAEGTYSISVHDVGSAIVVAAPHGGGIEPGTSEIALAIAGEHLSYYLFEGNKKQGNGDLHIASSNFDEPRCLSVLRSAHTVVTVHGEDSAAEVVYVGGRHSAGIVAVRQALEEIGFVVRTHQDPDLQGTHPRNICNIGSTGMGVQLELSSGLRRSFFPSLKRDDRKKPLPRLAQFAKAISDALHQHAL